MFKEAWTRTGSHFAQFAPNTSDHSLAATAIRKLALPFKADQLPPDSRAMWYELGGMPSLLSFLNDFAKSKAVDVRPLEDLLPENRESAQALQRAEEEFFAREALLLAEAAAAQRAMEKAAHLERSRALVAEQLTADTWLTLDNPRPSVLEKLTAELQALNRLSNGYCKLVRHRDGTMELDLWVQELDWSALVEVAKTIATFTVFNRTPATDDKTLAHLTAAPLFEELYYPAYPRHQSSVVHGSISLNFYNAFVKNIMLGLKPGIRGWDLPTSAPVLDYVPPPAIAPGELISSIDLPGYNRKVWNEAARLPNSEMKPLLEQYGLTFTWGPPAIRYVEASPYLDDDKAPLMLCRLTCERDARAVDVGFEKINLMTGQSHSCFFQEPHAHTALIRPWTAKAITAICGTVQDAICVNSLTRLPVMVAPTARALAELEIPTICETLYIFLPESTAWAEAALALTRRTFDTGPRLGVLRVPLLTGDASQQPWSSYLKAFKASPDLISTLNCLTLEELVLLGEM